MEKIEITKISKTRKVLKELEMKKINALEELEVFFAAIKPRYY